MSGPHGLVADLHVPGRLTARVEADAGEVVAVIGPNADVARLGGYYGIPRKTVSPLAGIRALVGNRANIVTPSITTRGLLNMSVLDGTPVAHYS